MVSQFFPGMAQKIADVTVAVFKVISLVFTTDMHERGKYAFGAS